METFAVTSGNSIETNADEPALDAKFRRWAAAQVFTCIEPSASELAVGQAWSWTTSTATVSITAERIYVGLLPARTTETGGS